jgi:hypothetical protein
LCGFQADEGKVERARNDGMKKQGRKGGNERDKGRE